MNSLGKFRLRRFDLLPKILLFSLYNSLHLFLVVDMMISLYDITRTITELGLLGVLDYTKQSLYYSMVRRIDLYRSIEQEIARKYSK